MLAVALVIAASAGCDGAHVDEQIAKLCEQTRNRGGPMVDCHDGVIELSKLKRSSPRMLYLQLRNVELVVDSARPVGSVELLWVVQPRFGVDVLCEAFPRLTHFFFDGPVMPSCWKTAWPSLETLMITGVAPPSVDDLMQLAELHTLNLTKLVCTDGYGCDVRLAAQMRARRPEVDVLLDGLSTKSWPQIRPPPATVSDP